MPNLEANNQLKKWKEDRLGFETMVSNLSAVFVNLPATQVDRNIEKGLEMIIEFLGLERASILKFSEDLNRLEWTHSAGVEIDKRWRNYLISDEHLWLTKMLREGKTLCLPNAEAMPEEAAKEKAFWRNSGIKSNLTIPLMIGDAVLGAISFSSFRENFWPGDLIPRLKLIGEVFANALIRMRTEIKLKKAFSEIKKLKDQLHQENIYLQKKIETKHSYEQIVGDSNAIKKVLNLVEQVADTNSTVLIQGETGTGKELIALAIHNLSPRKNRAMVTVNCAALPATLLESELFGCEKGAYTGALSKQIGRFEVASGSTIFLDEIGELPLELQAKILRVLQEGKFERLGSSETIASDVRVIAATNRDLLKEISKRQFREDLYYRLNVFPISVPPLRDRKEDIPLLAWTFVQEFSESMGKTVERIPRILLDGLQAHLWPGNVRELRNVIERAMILSKGPTLQVDAPKIGVTSQNIDMTLEEVERSHIIGVLEKVQWRIRGKNGAAEILGLKPTTLDSRIKKLGIQRQAKGYDIA